LTFDRSGLIPIETYAPGSKPLLAAVNAAKRGDWAGAEADFSALVRAEPSNLAAREGEAECANKLGHGSALRRRLTDEIKRSPNNYRTYYERGMLDFSLAFDGPLNHRRGSEDLGQAYFIRPDAWPIAIASADQAMGLMVVKGARQMLRRVIKENPDRRDFLPAYARSLMFGSIASGHYDEKAKRMVLDPPDPEKMPQPTQAMEILKSLMKSAPRCAYVYELAGYCSEITRRSDMAGSYYAKYKAMTRNNPKGREDGYRG